MLRRSKHRHKAIIINLKQPPMAQRRQQRPIKQSQRRQLTVPLTTTTTSQATGATITEAAFESQGVVYLNGNKWTYYSGSTTADGTNISANGLDSNGYRVVAAPASVAFGTKIMTPLGMGVVHDRGTAITGNHYDVVIQ